MLYNGRPLSPKIAPSDEGIWTPSNYDSLGHSEPTIQTASRSVEPFLHRWPQSVPILHNGTPLSPQNCSFQFGIWIPSYTWFPGPTRVLNPNGISIGSAVFVWLTSVTDIPTDHATLSVTIVRAMRCKIWEITSESAKTATAKLLNFQYYSYCQRLRKQQILWRKNCKQPA